MAKLQTRIDAQLKGFQAKMKLAVSLSKKVLPEELNRRMLQLIVGAKGVKGLVQLTKKATEERIRADMAKVVTYRLPSGNAHTGPLARILAAQWLRKKGVKITRALLDRAEQDIITARVRSRAYIAASWLWAAQGLARSVPGNTLTRLADNRLPVKDNGTAYNAFQKTTAATPQVIRVTVWNTARGASIIAARAIPRALSNAQRDMGKYIGRKLGEEYARMSR